MECTYTYKFVVDEFGRPGGMYSLADLPITGYKELVTSQLQLSAPWCILELYIRC